MKRRSMELALIAALSGGTIGGCFSPSDDDGGSGSGGTGGDSGSAGDSGSGGTGAVGGFGTGAIGGFGGEAGDIGGMGAVGGVGGDSGASGSAGVGGSTGECMAPGNCRLVSDVCCGCPPLRIEDVRAVSKASMDFGADCAGVLCGACPEVTEPTGVVADCVMGRCLAVELSQQPYTECASDADCELRPLDCCGFCGEANLQNSFAVRAGAQFNDCQGDIGCPPIFCGETSFLVEAFCTDEKHCSVRLAN